MQQAGQAIGTNKSSAGQYAVLVSRSFCRRIFLPGMLQVARVVVGILLVVAAAPGSATAQHAGPERGWFVSLQGGAGHYYGDLQTGVVEATAWRPAGSVGAGYRLSASFAVAAAYRRGWYEPLETGRGDGRREAALLLLHYTAARLGRWGLVATVGLHATEGADYASFGPVAGAGLEWPLGRRVTLLARVLMAITVPDPAVDGVVVDNLGGVDRRYQFDLLTHVGLGLQVAL